MDRPRFRRAFLSPRFWPLWCGLGLLWLIVQPMVIAHQVTGMILPEDIASGSSRDLVMTDVRRIAEGMDSFAASGMAEAEIVTLSQDPAALKTALEGAGVALGAEINPHVAAAAVTYRQDMALGRMWMAALALASGMVPLAMGSDIGGSNVGCTISKSGSGIGSSDGVASSTGISSEVESSTGATASSSVSFSGGRLGDFISSKTRSLRGRPTAPRKP